MTDRIRFENKALEIGATIAISTPTILKVISVNGAIITTYFFDENGKFLNSVH